jgi:hypothetical protein
MKLRLSDWASVAEIASGIAVIISLILLFLGIRENTEVTRATIYTDVIDSINGLSSDMYRDPELSRIYSAFFARDTASLDEADEARLVAIIFTLLRTYEKAFVSRRYGVIGDAEWSRFERAICQQYDNYQAFIRDSNRSALIFRNALTDEFQDFLAASCTD